MGFFDKLFGKKEKEQLDKGLERTREGFFSKLSKAIAGKSQVDDDVLDQLEEALITADVGVDTTLEIIEKIQSLWPDDCCGIIDSLLFSGMVDPFGSCQNLLLV
jgi:fused signal recognition particle receptor